MVKSNKNKKKITKKVNMNSLKSIMLSAAFAAALIVSGVNVHAAENDPAQQDSQGGSVAVGVEISTTTMMCTVKDVSVMKEPDAGSETLGELAAGTNIFAVELTDEGWYRVVYGGETGYIIGDSLAVYENMEAWLASEPEPEFDPVVEPDNAAGEAQAGEKNNVFTILVIITLVISIFGYAVIQIVKDNKNPDEKAGKASKDESGEDDSDGEPEDDGQEDEEEYEGGWEDDDEPEEDEESDADIEIMDLDGDE